MLYVRPAEIKRITSQQELEVLHAFFEALDEEDLAKELSDENRVVINQSEMAIELGMQRSNVARAIKKLIQVGFLMPGPKAGHFRTYQLNRHVAWKDNAKNWALAREEHYQKQRRAANATEHLKERMKAAKINGVIQGGEPGGDTEEPLS